MNWFLINLYNYSFDWLILFLIVFLDFDIIAKISLASFNIIFDFSLLIISASTLN